MFYSKVGLYDIISSYVMYFSVSKMCVIPITTMFKSNNHMARRIISHSDEGGVSSFRLLVLSA